MHVLVCCSSSIFPATQQHQLVAVTGTGRSIPDSCMACGVARERECLLKQQAECISETCSVAAPDLHDLPKIIAVRVLYCLFALPSTISFTELTLYDRKEKVPPNR